MIRSRTLLNTLTLSALLPLGLATISINANATDSLKVSAEQRTALSLTLYNQDLGLVRESRQVPILNRGQSVLIEDVSAQLNPRTLQLKNAGRIIEQNHNTDLLSYHRLLEHFLGQTIQLAEHNPATGKERLSTIRLMAINGSQILIQRNGQLETLSSHYRFIFPEHPDNLTLKPAISFRTEGTLKPATAEISYLTSGLSWEMDYVLELNKEGTQASLNGFATLSNQTGSSFMNASVNLLAGSVNQPQPAPVMYRKARAVMMADNAEAGMAAPQRQQLQDFHLYSLPQPVNLQNNQQKQVSLLNSEQIRVERELQLSLPVYASPQPEIRQQNPQTRLKFTNTPENGLGEPMPAGSIRVFSPDKSDQAQFVGGSQIDNQARGNEVYIQLGQAFDVTVSQQQTRFEKQFNGVSSLQTLTLKNSGERPTTLKLSTRFQKRWQISDNSQPYTRNGNTALWVLKLPANSSTELTFTVRQFEK
ncbi:MAG: DUF4139 domain-containing protein [Marinobacterium sp.]|nr:DUF4139 domain-containing protein [Marinobacterium sp.]